MEKSSRLWPGRGPIQTRVGRRVFVLFMVCAVLPVSVLGVASYFSIADSLREQAFDRSRLSAKRIGSALLERFGNLSSSLSSTAAGLSRAPLLVEDAAASDRRFLAMAAITGDSQRVLFGTLPAIPQLTARQQRHVQTGGTIITFADKTSNRILMAREIVNGGIPTGMIWAEVSDSVIDRLYAAEAASGLPTSSCIVLRDGSIVRCSGGELLDDALAPALTSESAGAFVWKSESDERYLAGFWSLFLDAQFASPDWRIIFSEPEAEILAPLTRFRQTFALAAVLALLIVALLSTGQIRRSLGPLAALRAGTDRIARLEFDQPVALKSGDEFEDLADAFNSMSDRVQTQFVEAGRLNQALAGKSDELEEREARLAAILNAAADAIVTVDAAGRIESFNRTAERIFGLSEAEALDRPLDDLFGVPLAFGPTSLQTQHAGSPMLEVAGRRRDGATFPAEVKFTEAQAGNRTLRTVFIRDISERKRGAEERDRLEAQLRHAQKMETVGTLAGGIAHDFNNILTPIIGNVEFALEDSTSAGVKADLRQVLEAAMRAKDLVRQILLFSRRSETTFRTIDVRPIVKEALTLLRASLPATIEIESSVAPDVEHVMGDPTQLHQVLMNLCTNAYHAMQDRGGVLHVQVDMVDTDAIAGDRVGEWRAVRLVVRDTGSGMDAATLERLFEPFFTTKPAGEGTGLGMSIVHGIITQHGGTIAVRSVIGSGTTFEIHLPAAEQEAEAEDQATAPNQMRGEGRILVVDDDAVIAQFVARVLMRAGYDVVQATAPLEVPAMLAEAEPSFDLVITDHTMPGMTGLELSDRIQTWRPGFPVVLLSGYSEFAGREDPRKHGLREVLMKPVPIAVLAATVTRILSEERSTLTAGESRRAKTALA